MPAKAHLKSVKPWECGETALHFWHTTPPTVTAAVPRYPRPLSMSQPAGCCDVVYELHACMGACGGMGAEHRQSCRLRQRMYRNGSERGGGRRLYAGKDLTPVRAR